MKRITWTGGAIGALVLALVACGGGGGGNPFFPPPVAVGDTVALTASGQIVSFNRATPTTLVGSVTVTGLAPGETLLGIDYRPADGKLYALGSGGSIYRGDRPPASRRGRARCGPVAGDDNAVHRPVRDQFRRRLQSGGRPPARGQRHRPGSAHQRRHRRHDHRRHDHRCPPAPAPASARWPIPTRSPAPRRRSSTTSTSAPACCTCRIRRTAARWRRAAARRDRHRGQRLRHRRPHQHRLCGADRRRNDLAVPHRPGHRRGAAGHRRRDRRRRGDRAAWR